MSPEERQLLSALFDRIRTASSTPRDPEAERLIADAMRLTPSAPYYLAQAVIVQEKGLEAASARINELEARIRELEAAAVQEQPQARGGFLDSIFGSGRTPAPSARPAQAPVQSQAPAAGPWGSPQSAGYGQQQAPIAPQGYAQQPAYPPQPSGPWSAARGPSMGGGGFLTGALGTAAGVAGGMLLANSLSGIFSNHMSGLGLGNPAAEGFGGGPIEETVINNYYGDAPNETIDASDVPDTSADDDIQQADASWGGDDSDFDNSDDSDFA
ncbi:hypothetical protein J2858_001741 [Neorhizobium galegae]|uniref:DUF2076 domain-containing protein n=1 Tax=Neorhizobium galegae TaxID=399 RepID=UPI001AEAA167|nr:DUF2076 domain-containing protein [Neorhizobium galegae]MBP2548825.1 hypothetical protein [Neorhizobium galegae]